MTDLNFTRPDACSLLAGDEPLAGSAPLAVAWLVVEHPGPWGHDALTESAIPESVVQHISKAQTQSPLRFLAARSTDQDRRQQRALTRRHIWIAHCQASGSQTRVVEINNLEELLDWDLTSISEGLFPVTGAQIDSPLEFVCTHSKRDTCCAVLGRARVAAVPDHLRTRVWECSHLGGHRFAATSLFLPSGRLYGRLSGYSPNGHDHVREPSPEHLRGPSYLDPALQSAECVVRIEQQLTDEHILVVTVLDALDSSVFCDVTSSDGGNWTVVAEREIFVSPASCGAQDQERSIWRARIIERGF